jgi:hypothetical protein
MILMTLDHTRDFWGVTGVNFVPSVLSAAGTGAFWWSGYSFSFSSA